MEARSAFGDEQVYVEKLIERGRHVEVQILADQYGHAVHLGERDCTVQRNHQKLIEESPSPAPVRAEIERTCTAAAQAARAIGYVGAGTFEFILDEGGTLRFIEMNTRLQVEHTVTEMRTGLDLVAAQIGIAAGQPLAVSQSDVKLKGHAIEVRINAEDPRAGFRPSPGRIGDWREPPRAADLRVETHVQSGYTVPPHYDSLLCKIVAWGPERNQAADRLLSALDQFSCTGVATTAPLHQAILRSTAFRGGNYHTGQLPGWEGQEV
jgi:acetyl-CoA carboxylase biotin carboxylase subunit